VDPMAASAEYELEKRVERLDLFPVELEKGNERAFKILSGILITNLLICNIPIEIKKQ